MPHLCSLLSSKKSRPELNITVHRAKDVTCCTLITCNGAIVLSNGMLIRLSVHQIPARLSSPSFPCHCLPGTGLPQTIQFPRQLLKINLCSTNDCQEDAARSRWHFPSLSSVAPCYCLVLFRRQGCGVWQTSSFGFCKHVSYTDSGVVVSQSSPSNKGK